MYMCIMYFYTSKMCWSYHMKNEPPKDIMTVTLEAKVYGRS